AEAVPAELLHRDVERDARTQAAFEEQQAQGLAGEHLAGAATLHARGEVEQVGEFARPERLDGKEIALVHAHEDRAVASGSRVGGASGPRRPRLRDETAK